MVNRVSMERMGHRDLLGQKEIRERKASAWQVCLVVLGLRV